MTKIKYIKKPLKILHYEAKLKHVHNFEKLDSFQCHFITIQDYESNQFQYQKKAFMKNIT